MERILEAQFERSESDLIPVVLATQHPVDRDGYQEVFDLSRSDSVDLSRAPLPLIEAHQNTIPVGIVENLRVIGGKLRGVVRMGNSARAKELLQDIQERILRNVSIGYRVLDYIDSGDTRTVTRLQPYELSLVAAPADPHSQLFRSIKMPDDNITTFEKPTRNDRKRIREATEAEQDRVRYILQSTDSLKGMNPDPEFHRYVEAESRKAIDQQWDAGEFGTRMLRKIPGNGPLGSDFHETGRAMDIPGKERRQYSLTNAILSMTDPSFRGGGYEIECSQQFEKESGKKTRGMHIPFSELQSRAITKGGTGSSTIEDSLLVGDFIDILRARSAILQQPITSLEGNMGNLRVPRLDGSSTAYWFLGDDADSITESTPALDEVNLSPHPLGGLVTYSHLMLKQGTPATEGIIRNDLAMVLATEVDRAAFGGSGVGAEPLGILGTNGITSVVDAAPDWAAIVQMESDLVAANADIPSMGYVVAAGLLPTLKTTAKDTGSGLFLWDSSSSYEGRMNGYPAMATNQLDAGHILFAAWSQFLFATWGSLELESDPYTRFAQGSVQVRAIMDVDFGVRHAASFSVITPA